MVVRRTLNNGRYYTSKAGSFSAHHVVADVVDLWVILNSENLPTSSDFSEHSLADLNNNRPEKFENCVYDDL